jgi:hypothetical protein
MHEQMFLLVFCRVSVFWEVGVVVLVKFFLTGRPPILEGHNFHKSKQNWVNWKFNGVPIDGLQITFRLYHQPSDNYGAIV